MRKYEHVYSSVAGDIGSQDSGTEQVCMDIAWLRVVSGHKIQVRKK